MNGGLSCQNMFISLGQTGECPRSNIRTLESLEVSLEFASGLESVGEEVSSPGEVRLNCINFCRKTVLEL